MGDVQVESFRIPEGNSLDPIEVFVTVYCRTSARVTVACYGDAWTTIFGAMGGTWREFLAGCSPEYLGNALARTRNSGRRDYAVRIARAIIDRVVMMQREETAHG